MGLRMARRECPRVASWRRALRLHLAALGLSLRRSPRRSRNALPALDRPLDEGHLPPWSKAVSGPLRPALLHQGRARRLQPGAAADSGLPPLREGREGLRRAPEVSEPPRPEPHGLLGRYRARPSSEVQDTLARERAEADDRLALLCAGDEPRGYCDGPIRRRGLELRGCAGSHALLDRE